MADFSYIGKGQIYLGLKAGGEALRPIGNVGSLELTIEEEKKELPDFTSSGGGFYNTLSRVTGVTGTITMHDLSPKNLALALRGAASTVTTGAITDESHTGYAGGLVDFAKQPDTTQTITVTSDPAGTTYVEDTDYTVTRSGIVIIAGGAITDGTAILVDYTPVAAELVQALTASANEYKMVLDGLNEARSGKATTHTMYRVKFSPVQGLSLIGDDFAGMQLTFDVLKDTTITGAGLSQYMKLAQAT